MTLQVCSGDITKQDVDIVVNAANSSLMGGGGVDGAIHSAAGPILKQACRAVRAQYGPCRTGEAVITIAGDLPSAFVIHTVGPVWDAHTPEEADKLLSSCYRASLDLARKVAAQTIAFPNISTGIYGFPKERAAQVALSAVRAYDGLNDHFERIVFVCFDEENLGIYQSKLAD